MISIMQRKPPHVSPNQHFSLSTKHKGGHWWVHEYIVRTMVYQKAPSGWSDVKQWKIKPVTLAAIELHLSAQLVGQLLSQSITRKFC